MTNIMLFVIILRSSHKFRLVCFTQTEIVPNTVHLFFCIDLCCVSTLCHIWSESPPWHRKQRKSIPQPQFVRPTGNFDSRSADHAAVGESDGVNFPGSYFLDK